MRVTPPPPLRTRAARTPRRRAFLKPLLSAVAGTLSVSLGTVLLPSPAAHAQTPARLWFIRPSVPRTVLPATDVLFYRGWGPATEIQGGAVTVAGWTLGDTGENYIVARNPAGYRIPVQYGGMGSIYPGIPSPPQTTLQVDIRDIVRHRRTVDSLGRTIIEYRDVTVALESDLPPVGNLYELLASLDGLVDRALDRSPQRRTFRDSIPWSAMQEGLGLAGLTDNNGQTIPNTGWTQREVDRTAWYTTGGLRLDDNDLFVRLFSALAADLQGPNFRTPIPQQDPSRVITNVFQGTLPPIQYTLGQYRDRANYRFTITWRQWETYY